MKLRELSRRLSIRLRHLNFALLRVFVGFISEARLRRTAAEGGLNQTVATLVESAPQTQPDDTLVRAVVTM